MTLKDKILSLDFAIFPPPKKRGVAMRRYLAAQQQLLEIRDFIRNPRLYWQHNPERATRLASIFRQAILWLCRRPRRYRTYAISLGLYKFPWRGSRYQLHYCLVLYIEGHRASDIKVALEKTVPDNFYVD